MRVIQVFEFFIFGFVLKCECLDFSSVPTTVKTHRSSTVLLPCYLETTNNDDASAIHIRWIKDDTTIYADSALEDVISPERFHLWPNGSLQVVDVQPSDTGIYTCEVIRPEPWAPVKQVHAIEVLQPPTITPDPESRFLEVKLGEPVRIGCITGGVPTPIVVWNHNGELLQLINNRNILEFNATNRHLAGIYECVAMNGVGDTVRDHIELKILYPPEVSAPRNWIHTSPDLKVQLECKVNSIPPATVAWYKGEKLLKTDRRVLQLSMADKNTLLIRKVTAGDFGLYSCRAVNAIGEGIIEYQLSGVPNPANFTLVHSENDKDSCTLIWKVESYAPVIEYSLRFRPYKPAIGNNLVNRGAGEWTNLTIPTEHRTNSLVHSKKYTLRGLKERTTYEVQVLSRNRYGWSKPSAILRFSIDAATEAIITTIVTEPDNYIETVTPLEITSGTNKKLSPIIFLLAVSVYLNNKFM